MHAQTSVQIQTHPSVPRVNSSILDHIIDHGPPTPYQDLSFWNWLHRIFRSTHSDTHRPTQLLVGNYDESFYAWKLRLPQNSQPVILKCDPQYIYSILQQCHPAIFVDIQHNDYKILRLGLIITSWAFSYPLEKRWSTNLLAVLLNLALALLLKYFSPALWVISAPPKPKRLFRFSIYLLV